MGDFSFDVLVGSIREIDSRFVSSAVKAVNVNLTLRNWCIGAYISEFELHGSNRAGYGDRLLFSISKDLQSAGLKRCDQRELQRYVLFYRRYPGFGSLLPEAVKDQYLSICSADGDGQNTYIGGIEETVSPKFGIPPEKIITSLSFSHLSEIIDIEDPLKRLFYEIECIKGCWSVRELKRQIGSMYFERSGLSGDKEELCRLLNDGAEISSSLMAIRDPYVFEFLGLKPAEVMDESEFESALRDKLENFLLELGRGFCFEGRQKRILIGNEYFFVDLVFYHRILKCHVLVELKTRAIIRRSEFFSAPGRMTSLFVTQRQGWQTIFLYPNMRLFFLQLLNWRSLWRMRSGCSGRVSLNPGGVSRDDCSEYIIGLDGL